MSKKVVVTLEVDAKGAVTGVRTAEGAFVKLDQQTRRTEGRLDKLRAALKAVVAAGVIRELADVAQQMFDLGAAAVETASRFETVMGPAASRVDAQLKEFANTAGLTQTQARGLGATFAAVSQGMGDTQAESAELSVQALKLAADFSSFNNLPIEQTMNAITSATVGEREALKTLGVVLTEAEVKAAEATKEFEGQSRAQVTLELITRKAGVAVGDLVRTQDSAANQARKLRAELGDVRDEIAVGLLPVFADLLEVGLDLVPTLRDVANVLTGTAEASTEAGKAVELLVDDFRDFVAIARVGHDLIKTIEGALPGLDINLRDHLIKPIRDSLFPMQQWINYLADAARWVGLIGGGLSKGDAGTKSPGFDAAELAEASGLAKEGFEAASTAAASTADSASKAATEAKATATAYEEAAKALKEMRERLAYLDANSARMERVKADLETERLRLEAAEGHVDAVARLVALRRLVASGEMASVARMRVQTEELERQAEVLGEIYRAQAAMAMGRMDRVEGRGVDTESGPGESADALARRLSRERRAGMDGPLSDPLRARLTRDLVDAEDVEPDLAALEMRFSETWTRLADGFGDFARSIPEQLSWALGDAGSIFGSFAAVLDAKMAALGEGQEARERELLEKKKKLALVQAVVGTAAGIADALRTGGPFPFNLAAAAAVAAQGYAQVATIRAQRVPGGGSSSGSTAGSGAGKTQGSAAGLSLGYYPGSGRDSRPQVVNVNVPPSQTVVEVIGKPTQHLIREIRITEGRSGGGSQS